MLPPSTTTWNDPFGLPGAEPVRVQRLHAVQPSVSVQEAERLVNGGAIVFDVERRAAYERSHIDGALFAVPDRLEEFLAIVTPFLKS